MKNIHYEQDYEKFLKEFEASRKKLGEYMKSLPFEKKWEILQKTKGFISELKKSKTYIKKS
jgi:hypothetical protein